MLQKILNYWYQLEYFNPCWPINTYDDTDLTKQDLPWQNQQQNPKTQISYDIYFGKAQSNDLIVFMLKKLNLNIESASIETDNSLVCLCAIKINEQGKYVPDSFAISSFVWAIFKLISAGSTAEKLDVSELEMLQRKVNDWLLQDYEDPEASPVSKDYLKKVYERVCHEVKVNHELFEASVWSRQKVQHANKNGDFPPVDPATELLQSFYLRDMGEIKKLPTQIISRYVNALIEPSTERQRIQIDTDVRYMQQWLKADCFPLGVWPSPYSPSLMQQLGINIAIAGEQDIFSVNGPPGTGKTTLLKEIVVSNIIQRALVMVSYDSPEKAFTKAEMKNPPDQFSKSFYKINKKLSGYGMVVVSNNNAAVENISIQLPKAIERDRTGRFSSIGKEIANTYFADIATKLLGEPAWGLISAKMGKKSNIKTIKERLWWADDEVTLKHYYDEANVPDWNTARQNFRAALQAVETAREDIKHAQVLLAEQKQAVANQMAAQVKNDEAQAEFFCRQTGLLEEQQNLSKLEGKLVLQQRNIAMLRANLSFLKLVFWRVFKNNPLIKEWKQTEQDIQETIILITKQRTICHTQEEIVRAVQIRYQASEDELHQAEQKLHAVNTAIVPYKERFADNWADAAFWENIYENEHSQVLCPWAYAEYDKMREELFYQALMLHKAFVLSSNCVKQNLMRLFVMWDGKFTTEDCKAAYGHLFNTLLLVIPVVSTTFASVQSFLEGIQPEEIGLLVVDEAGQATPQSVLGALWRTKKAIIVGDPLQVEPIVTIPNELRKRFADENNIPSMYRVPELSVQVLADQLNSYGGIRNLEEEKLWLGCPLVVHRRCLNPMFRISNEVAYNGRMFSKTALPDREKQFLLEQSVWFDVKGVEKGNKNHVVQQQLDIVITLVEKAIDIYAGLPDLYIITPFTSVDRALKKAIHSAISGKLPKLDVKDINVWLNENCGTIHTFQGKEANEVLLVLGCDAQTGKSAAQWVGRKPNIINVAVSRSKYRLGVIGDYDLWKNIPYVRTVCKYLKKQ
ncbi:MAG: AAA domain-containing protein [Clostridiaceae bacterium]